MKMRQKNHARRVARTGLALLGAALWLGAAPGARAQTYTNLHTFTGGASDGAGPYGSLTLSGTNFYGTTDSGGTSNNGVVFKINLDGSGYTNLHSFAGGAGDGCIPYGTLTLNGTNLYGMTYQGGALDYGVVFKLNTDGSGYTNLHEFAGGAGDGSQPTGSLTMSGTNLYGMVYAGGVFNRGVVFTMNADGSGYTNLHEFVGGSGDGQNPYGSLTLSGTTLYGMTDIGGVSNKGVVFMINTDGSGYTNLHKFVGGDGDAPYFDSLVLNGAALYGMTYLGGVSNKGVVFTMNTDGSGYTKLHQFFGGASDGMFPLGSLTLSGTTLYGMTYQGGASNKGVVFALSPSIQATVTVVANPASGGSATGGGTYAAGTNIQLAATASNNWLFTAWNDGATNNPYTITVSATNITYTANFAAVATISVAASTNIGGSVTGGGTFIIGSNAVLSATPSNGWMFTSWNNGSTNNPLTIVVASNVTYTANFALPAAMSAQFFFQDGGGQVAALLLETNGNIQASRLLGAAGGWQLKAAGDVDRDGVCDLLFQTAGGDVAIWFLNTNGTLKGTHYVGNTGAWQLRACDDYDGDWHQEIFFQNAAGDVAYWNTTTNGTCTGAILLGNTGAWQLKTAAHVLGGWQADLFWQRSDGLVAAWFHHGASINAVLLGNTGGWDLRAAVDVDGDGYGDLAWQTAAGKVGAWFMNTNGTPRAASYWWTTGGWQLKAAGK